jgi:hypothetical protein
MRVPPEEIQVHPLSFVDPNGRLFWWSGDLYRAISNGEADRYKGLFEDQIVQQLVESGFLVGSDLTELSLEGFPLVIRHHALPFPSYPTEWCGPMLQEAALLVLDLQKELSSRGMQLQDAHPWNVLFDGPKPYYVDLGSIVPAKGEAWLAMDEYVRFFLNPLLLFSQGHGRIARWLLNEFDGVRQFEVEALIRPPASWIHLLKSQFFAKARRSLPASLKPIGRKLSNAVRGSRLKSSQGSRNNLDEVRERVKEISFQQWSTDWSEYCSQFPELANVDSWNEKQRNVYSIVEKIRPRTVLDLGTNKGWFAQAAAQLGCDVVAIDVDEPSISALYRTALSSGLSIQPLLTDLRMAKGTGFRNQIPAAQRFRCEMILCLALLHHLVLKQGLGLAQVVDMLLEFRPEYLLLEFVPPEDDHVRLWKFDPGRYSEKLLLDVLESRFRKVSRFPSSPRPRLLFLCER